MKYFCEKCEKMVPDSEVKPIIGATLFHQYDISENYYNNAGTNKIGYYPIKKHILCDKVREPTDIEYFIYYTCQEEKPSANRRPKK